MMRAYIRGLIGAKLSFASLARLTNAAHSFLRLSTREKVYFIFCKRPVRMCHMYWGSQVLCEVFGFVLSLALVLLLFILFYLI